MANTKSLLQFEAPKKLLPGKYLVGVKSYKDNSDEKGERINVELQFEDKIRNYTIFPSNVQYVASCLQNQFEITDEISLEELLDMAVEKGIFVVVDYNEFGLNIALHEKKVPAEEQTVNVEDVQA